MMSTDELGELGELSLIKEVIDGVYTVREAAERLNPSGRHVKRLKRRVREEGGGASGRINCPKAASQDNRRIDGYLIYDRLRKAGLISNESPKDIIEPAKPIYQVREWNRSEIAHRI
ncbi:MAG: hypothetical protein LBR96_01390 [Treponema sp.]|nr:hypothetical protein [Treponema sp.]